MKLLNVVRTKLDPPTGLADHPVGFGVAGNFLFVVRRERNGKQILPERIAASRPEVQPSD